MGRRHFLDTRIVMKNSVYVVGMKIPGSSPEESISILRSNEYFGQYGKIARLYLKDRTSISSVTPGPDSDTPATSTGIYIVYVRREDAARAISSLDGIPAPQGPPGQVLHASYGTARYCDAFLRGLKCDNAHCHNLHEWGGEGDCFTRSDLITALTRPAEYDARQKQSQIQPPPLSSKSAWPKPSHDDVDSNTALPRSASWGMRPSPARPGSATGRPSPVGSSRPTKIQSTLIPLGRSSAAFPPPAPSPAPPVHQKKEKKPQNMTRVRSEASSAGSAAGAVSTNAGSAHNSPKKKPVTVNITPHQPASSSSTSTPTSTTTTTTKSAPPPPPGLAPPPGLGPSTTASTTSTTTTEKKSKRDRTPTPPAHAEKPSSKSTTTSATAPPEPEKKTSKSEPQPTTTQPEAGPSSPKKEKETEYLIHSPYPDFDDVFTEPDAREAGFSFSLGIDEAECKRLLALAHELGAFEPTEFDPLFEELPKLGIPLTSLIAVPRAENVGYNGSFAPFAPSSPIETAPSSDERADSEDPAPRTASRFEFARRGSLASGSARSGSPFRGRDEWAAAAAANRPSSNGYEERHFHPALAQLNSGLSSVSALQGSPQSAGEYYGPPRPYQYGGSAYGSPQRETHYAVPPGYDYGHSQQQVYGGVGYGQRRF